MSDPPNAFIDPETGLRRYRWGPHILTSATSLRRVVGMPMPLAAWQVNQVIDAILDDPDGELLRQADAVTVTRKRGESELAYWERLRKEQRKPIRAAAMAERDYAANLGTDVHAAAEIGLKSRGLIDADPRKPFLATLERWQEKKQPRHFMSEFQVFNLTIGYAGTVDSIDEVDGRMTLIDYKTGKGTYADHAIQLALYRHAEFTGAIAPDIGYDVIDEVGTALLRSVEQMAVLHLRPEGWEWIVIPDTDELAAAAVDMVRFARWLEAHPTIESIVPAGSIQKEVHA